MSFREHTIRDFCLLLQSSNKSDRIMPSNKNAFNRYLILDELLSDRLHNYSIQDLTDIVEVRLSKDGLEGVTKRCIEKDIVDLEYAPVFAEIERYKSESGKRCVRYADPTFSIFNKKLSNEERNLLCEVLETIGQFDGLDNFEWLEAFRQKLGVKDHDRIIYFSNNPYLTNSNLLGTLFNYISNKVAIHLQYRLFNQEEIKGIDFHPYLLKQYNNRWFVIGAADSDGKILTFPLDRIQGINALHDLRYKPQPEGLTDRYEDIIGITYYENAPVEHITFWVSDKSSGYIATKPIHGSQREIKGENAASLYTRHPSLQSGTFFSIDCIINYELVREFITYGPELLVLTPVSLQEQISERVRQMNEKYLNLRI